MTLAHPARIGTIILALFAPASVAAQKILPISPASLECAVEFEHVLSLGAFDDPGIIGFPSQITRLGSGDFALATPSNGGEILVYDAQGRYRTSFGRRADDTGEWVDPGHGKLRTSPEGRALVLDPGAGRLSSLTARGDIQWSIDSGMTLAADFVPVIARSAFAVSGWDSEGDGTLKGIIRLVDAKGATLVEIATVLGEPWMQRLFYWPLATDASGRVWWARPTEYVLEAWDPEDRDGGLRLEGRPGWFTPGPPKSGFPVDDPYPSVIVSLRHDAGLLWIGTLVADKAWAEYADEVVPAVPLDNSRVVDTVINVVNPETGALVAHTIHDELLAWTGDGSLLYSIREDGVVNKAALFLPSLEGRECPT